MKYTNTLLLTCSAEIFILQYWISKYRNHFENDVTKLFLVLNWGKYWKDNEFLIDYVKKLLPEAEFVYLNENMSPEPENVKDHVLSGNDNVSAFGMTNEQRLARRNSYDVPDSKVVVFVTATDSWHRQGGCYNLVLPWVDTDLITSFDNDCFIFEDGIVKKYSEEIMSGSVDAIGSLGQWVSPDLMPRLEAKGWIGRVNPFFLCSMLRKFGKQKR